MAIELPAGEEFVGGERFSQRSKHHPSQFTKNLLKELLELKPTTILDPSHSTPSSSADQKIPFARVVGLEVTFASYGLLKDLLNFPRGAGAVGSHVVPRRSRYPSAVGSLLGDIVASQPQYPLPIVTRLNLTSGSEAVINLLHSSVTEPVSSLRGYVVDAVDLEDVPVAVPADHKRVRRMKRKKTAADLCKLSREGRPNANSKSSNDEDG